MKPKIYKDEGVVLARKSFGEADRILIVYTKKHGKVSLVAKGVRKLTSKKRGHIEIFSHINFSATVSQGMGLMAETITLNNFSKIRQDLKKVSVAYFLVETVLKLTQDEEHNEYVFDLLLTALKDLENSVNTKYLRNKFTTDILTTLGFWPLGQMLANPDSVLEDIVERRMSTLKIGKKLLS